MVLNYGDAARQLTAPGAKFELGETRIAGTDMRSYRHAPATLRDIFDAAPPIAGAALVYLDERYDLDEVRTTSLRLASALTACGVGKGDRVAIAMRNLPDYVFAFWATQRIGAVLAGLNAWWVGSELAFGLMDCQPKILLVDGERLDRLDEQMRRLAGRIVLTRAPGSLAHRNVQRWEEFLEEGAQPPPMPPLMPDDAATMLYTSGTTGKPKAAISTHRNHATNLMNLAFSASVARVMQGMPEGPVAAGTQAAALLPFPMFHIGGLSALYMNMAFGSRSVLMHKWCAQEAARLIEAERITSVALAPSMLKQLIESSAFARVDRSSLTSFATGSAPVPAELLRQAFESLGAGTMPVVGYGLTETTSGVCASAGDSLKAKSGSVGHVFPVIDIRIVDPDTSCDLDTGLAGEIWLRGPNVIGEYWNRPDANAASFVAEGWFRTGDVGRLDEDGYLTIVDRLKDMIIRGGENIYCVEVEEALLAHPGVCEVAVFGTPDALLGETVAAVVVLAPGIVLTEAELITFVRQNLAYFKVPGRIVMRLRELPRTPAGKVDKKVLRESCIC